MKSAIVMGLLCVVLGSGSAFATEESQEKPTLKWVGEIRDEASSHTNEHWHSLKFVKKDDGEVYDLDSSELTELHHKSEKNYLVEVEGEITPRFLFWGGNLKVNTFKVLAEGERIPHFKAERRLRGPGGTRY